MNGSITKILRFSVHDGPGIRTTVFISGCPLRCQWCHNPEAMRSFPEVLFFRSQCSGCQRCINSCPKKCFSWQGQTTFSSGNCDQCGICVANCPVGALKWSCRRVTTGDVMQEVLRDKAYYRISHGGVTLSGGEPLHQPEFSRAIARESKRAGLHVALETSGYADTKSFLTLLPSVDLFLYDIKCIDDALHLQYTGVSNRIILENFKELCKTGKAIVVRVPLVPRMTNQKKNLLAIERFVRDCKPGVTIEYLPFNRLLVEKYQMLGRECPVN